MSKKKSLFERMSEIARASAASPSPPPFSPDLPKGPDPDAIAAVLTPQEAAAMLLVRTDFTAAEIDASPRIVHELEAQGLVRCGAAWFVVAATPLGSRVVRSLQRKEARS